MRLRSLRIRGFAQLRGHYPLDAGADRLALLLADNESGKSTLAAAVRAALYGLESDRRRSRGKRTEQERYRPWNGGPYGLSLELTHQGRELTIDRDFAQNSVRVLAGAQEIGQQFQSGGEVRVGEALTGLTRRQFELSCFVGQGDLVFADASELGEALQRIAASDRPSNTAASAIGVLEQALAQYEGVTLKQRGQVATEIKRCGEEIVAAERQLAELERQRQAIGQEIDHLGEDAQRRELYEQRREILRARRQRSELEQLWVAQDQLREQAAKVDALAAQVERERSLRALDLDAVQQLRALRDRWTAEQAARSERDEAAKAADGERKLLEARARELKFTRRPTEADSEALLRAIQRLEDARLRHHELAAELAAETDELMTRGFALERAEQLTQQFEQLAPADRERILSRTQETLQLQQRQQSLSEEIARHKRRRAEIRQGQQKRKHFGIWCLVVGMLPIMVAITMHPHLPLSPWILYAVGAAFLLGGVIALISGQSSGRREDEALKPQLARLREQLQACEHELKQAGERWDAIAGAVGQSVDELEERYREWRMVDRAVDTIRRLRARTAQVEQLERSAMDGLSEVWELFGAPAAPEQLHPRHRQVQEGLRLHRELDAADALSREAQRRADEARALLRRREQEIRDHLTALGIELESDETLETGYQFLARREEAARAARDRAERELPEQQRRLRALGDASELSARAAALQHELEQREAVLRKSAARGGEFAFDEEELAKPCSAEAFDRGLARLDSEERQLRGQDEQGRQQAQSFLTRYEKEAPELRARLAEHRAALQRAEQFAAAITLARDTLEQIARETHRDWSSDLNAELGTLLRGLGSEVEEARLDEKLQLRLSRSEQLLAADEAQQHLSVGALETVYLALRLSLARALGGATNALPLILDDPFANSDDERLIQGLSLLIERIAPQQQVILMACQSSRYGWARHRLPDAAALHTIAIDALPGQDAAQ